jgi:hypothetical protein
VNSTLQACIDSAFSGDTVQIATNGPIDESISFAKELTLIAAAGFHPAFAATNSISAETSTSGDQTIQIEGLTLIGGEIRVVQGSTGVLTAQVLNNNVSTNAGTDAGILIQGSSGPISLKVSGNTLYVSANQTQEQLGIEVSALAAPAKTVGTIDHNSIEMLDLGEYAEGLQLNAIDADLTVDVIANHVDGVGYDDGIELSRNGGGTTTARILDNLVTGQLFLGGLTGAISVGANGGSLEVTIANNTLAYDDSGITTRIDAGVPANLSVVNNVFSGNRDVGMLLGTVDPATTVTQHHNLFFDDGIDIEATPAMTPGANSVFASPNYTGINNYRPMAPSAVIDAGDDTAVPADLTTDLDGNPRIQGAHVDIGAYETAPEPDAEVAVTALAALLGVRAREAARLRARRAA